MECHDGTVVACSGQGKVLMCESCGYAHLAHLPSPRQLEQYYQDEDQFYRSFAKPGWLQKEEWEYRRGFWDPAYKHRTVLLGGASKRGLLDIGCGWGSYLDYWIKQGGWEAWGTEPSGYVRLASPYRSRIVESLEDLDARTYEAVSMSLVLEHVRDPRQTLCGALPFMGVGSRLLVIVPNDLSPLQDRLGTTHYINKVHLNYFTPSTLRALLVSVGLQVIYETATFPMELFELMGIHYIGNDAVGKKCHQFRLRCERLFGPYAFKLYKMLYDRYGWGRELVFVARW